jgi:hypothetical protein
VNQESTTGFEQENQILPATFDRGDALACEVGGNGVWLARVDEPSIPDVDALEAPAGQ